MARTYPEKKEAAMSHISHHAAAGENPASRKPPVEETPGRKIVKGLFCAGVALSAILCAPHVSAASVYADQQTKKITVGTGESYGTVNGDVYGGHGSVKVIVSADIPSR